MFDDILAAVAAARTPGSGVRACARLENAACAARLGYMADLLAGAYAASGSANREQWRLDNWGAVCAQIGAAHAVTSGVVNGLLMDAVTLRERLPKVAAVFADGVIGYRLVHMICQRTALVTPGEALAAVDAELAEDLRTRGARSVEQAERDIDALVLRHDRYAVRRTESSSRGAYVEVATESGTGVSYVTATVSAPDGQAFDQRLDALARTVCPRDPRDLDQRRAAAVGALGFGWDRLPCLCETHDCDAATTPPAGGVVIHVIARHDTLDTHPDRPSESEGPLDEDDADASTDVEGPGDADDVDSQCDSEGPGDSECPGDADDADSASVSDGPRGPGNADNRADSLGLTDTDIGGESPKSRAPRDAIGGTESDAAAGEPETETSTTPANTGELTALRRALVGANPPLLPKPWYTYTLTGLLTALKDGPGQFCPAGPAAILGGAVLPAPVAAQIAMHAVIRELIHPGHAPPEPRYRPSRKLAEFVRCRDLTCRFPGCTRPATITDIDHTIPYPYGPTCASNLACLRLSHESVECRGAGGAGLPALVRPVRPAGV